MKKKLLVWLLMLLLLSSFSAWAEETAGAPAWQAYNGKRIGVLTGPLMEDIAHANFPDSEYLLFNSYPDCITALLAGRIDAYLGDEAGIKSVQAEQPQISYIHERLTENNYSFAFRKNDPKSAALCEELNAFLAKCWADGTMQELDDIWFGTEEERKIVDMSGLDGANGVIRVVTTSTDMPFSYIKDGKNVGYDIDLVVRFCRYAGYGLELGDVDFGARIPAVQSGKYDFSTDMNVTRERQEQVLFSDPTSKGGVVLAVLSDSPALAQQSAAMSEGEQEESPVTSLGRLLSQPGVRIAVGLDTPAEQTLAQDYPQAKLLPYSNIFLGYLDVINGRVDACVGARKEMEFAIRNGLSGVRLLDENYALNKIAVGISPVSSIPDLKGKLNTFIAGLKADGTLDDMYDRWVLRGEDTMPALPQAENASFTLRVGTTGSVMPYSYYVGTELAGYDIELAHRFAAWLGAKLDFGVFDFGGIVPAAAAGNIDCIMSNLFYTEEKDEAIPFSDVLFEVEITAMVRDEEQNNQSASASGFTSLSQLNGKRIGVATGTTFDAIVLNALPDAKLVYINSSADLIAALETGKIDGFAVDEPAARQFCFGNARLSVMDECLDSFEFGFVLPRTSQGDALLEEINAWLASMKESGELEKVMDKWANGPEEGKTLPDYAAFPAPKGTLTLATEGDYVPLNYYRGKEIVGAEIDLIAQFCEACGYGLKVKVMNFDGILPAVQTGKVDLAAAGVTITDERRESVSFSAPYYSGGTVMVVLKKEQAAAESALTSLSMLNGKRIGVQTGTSFDKAVSELLPDAQIFYFNSKADLTNALHSYKIDAYTVDEPVVKAQMQQDDRLTYIPEYMETFNFAYVFSKTETGQTLCDQFSEYLKTIRSDGTMAQIEAKWFSEDDSQKTLADYRSFPAVNGTLRMATEALYEPFSYILNNEIAGYDIDIAVRFCEAYGYGLEIVDMSFDAVLPSVQSGKCDFGGAGITITEERKESVLFSEANFSGGTVMAVLKSNETSAANGVLPELTGFSDLRGKTVSMLTGAPFEELVRSKAPDVGKFTSFINTPDMILALQSGKTDAFLTNNAIAALAVNRNHDLALFPQEFQDGAFGFAFAKDDPRRDVWQAAFDAIPKAEIQAAWNKWTGADESVKVLPEQDWPGTNGTVRVAACDTVEPMSYAGGDGQLKGFDIEVILMIAKELDVRVEFSGMDFAAILASVQTEKADIGAGSIIITPERAQAVDFLEYYPASFVLVVRAQKAPAARAENGETFWDGIKSSFNKTFIREGRWRLFVDGVLTTLLITVLSILFGTALGFLVFLMCRNGNPVANGVTRFSMWLVQGMPMVVLLMILYYVIFGSVAISGLAVAVIGFTLTFGAGVVGLLKMGVGAIDRGQYEAAYALGHSNRHAFFRIILPQAIPHVLPAYQGEIVGLVKATAIVGYIAVQDLTKMGDIVRSRTYEAFFPLIAITIIYFVLEGLFSLAVSRIRISIDPKKRRRDRILKGVNIHD